MDGAAIAAAERCLPRGHEGSAQRWLRWGGQLGVAAMLLPTLSQHIADHIEARHSLSADGGTLEIHRFSVQSS